MSSPFATTNSAKAFHPDVVGIAPTDVIPETLILQTSTKAGDVQGDFMGVAIDTDGIELPEVPDYPEAELDWANLPDPVIDSSWSFKEQRLALLEAKKYLR